MEQKNKINYSHIEKHIVKWLKDYLTKSGLNGFVVGISGGVDSAVVSTLCAKTGFPTYCVEIPIHQHPDHVSRASNHISWLKAEYGNQIKCHDIDLSSSFDHMHKIMPDFSVSKENLGLSGANMRSRLRMVVLYYISNSLKLLVAGTGNKVEDFGVGFFTLGGDSQVDISPIADLLKTEVWGLAKHLGINEEIVSAIPSDGLWGDDRSDENQLGASYEELEWAMAYIEKNYCDISMGVHPYNDVTERQMEVIEIYRGFNSRNQHKMVDIPVCNVSKFRK
jgi:NAD+ synthase|tara:strand:- start:11878 stop:12714 length:837 start_codon:yes stop_codon:yes gene_type:complete